MAEHQESCDVCEQIAACEANRHPRVIAEMESGWAVMGPVQALRGYSLLLVREPVTEIYELEEGTRAGMWRDLTALAQAVAETAGADKLNYEALGNVCHHLHWHIFPRRRSEPQPTLPVWNCMPDAVQAAESQFAAERDDVMREAIRQRLLELRKG